MGSDVYTITSYFHPRVSAVGFRDGACSSGRLKGGTRQVKSSRESVQVQGTTDVKAQRQKECQKRRPGKEGAIPSESEREALREDIPARRIKVGKGTGSRKGKKFRVGKPTVKAAWQEVAGETWRGSPHGGAGVPCWRSLDSSNRKFVAKV